MESKRLVILGAGSVRCSVPVIASLSTYFGERPLEVRMYDADLERLDLFDRFARVMFLVTKATHTLISTTDFHEAIEDADAAVLQVGENCARKFLKEAHRQGIASLNREAMIEQAVEEMVEALPTEAKLLSLERPDIQIPRAHSGLSWELSIADEDRPSVPHQVLRWIRGEDYLHELLAKYEKSPLKEWLDQPIKSLS